MRGSGVGVVVVVSQILDEFSRSSHLEQLSQLGHESFVREHQYQYCKGVICKLDAFQ